jgi:queuosine precursor transporter
MNELLFLFHLLCIGITTIIMLKMGAEALVALLCVQGILANLFVIKQITLFGLTATASDMYIVGSVLSLNLLQEYYGKYLARKSIWISFGLLIFYTIVSQIHIFYVPSASDFSQNYYYNLLSYMPRLTSASIIVYLIVQHFDTYFYAVLKRLLEGRYLLVRNMISITISQGLDTILFSLLGLYGIIDNIGQVMLVAFTIKITTMILLTPVVFVIKKYIQSEPI